MYYSCQQFIGQNSLKTLSNESLKAYDNRCWFFYCNNKINVIESYDHQNQVNKFILIKVECSVSDQSSN